MQSITLNLSEPLFQRAQLAAAQFRKPMNEVLTQALEKSLPKGFSSSNLDDVPAQMEDELAAMHLLSDEALFSLARSWFPQAKQKQMDKLFRQRSAGRLDEAGLATLEALVAEGGRHMLRRSQAMALLVGRGYDKSEFLPDLKI